MPNNNTKKTVTAVVIAIVLAAISLYTLIIAAKAVL